MTAENPTPTGPPVHTTAELLEEHLRGSGVASDKLFFDLRRSLLEETRKHPLVKMLLPEFSDEDVVSETFAELFGNKAFERFVDKGKGSLRAFLIKVQDRKTIDLLRKKTALKRGGGRTARAIETGNSSLGPSPPADQGPGPSTQVGTSDLLEHCLAALSGDWRAVWQLRILEGLSFGEIGRETNVTESAARGHFHRAVERLLEQGLFDDPA